MTASRVHTSPLQLSGRRVVLRTLVEADYPEWFEVRTRCRDWLIRWEPRPRGAPLPSEDRGSFAARCAIRERERQLGTGYGFGIFTDRFVGEVTLSSIQRGPFQTASIGYWVDEAMAGRGFVPEAVVVTLQFAFEALALHRVEDSSIIPRNQPSRRVVDKLGIRMEGVAERFLEIDGTWEDHCRYAITSEEWDQRRDELVRGWVGRLS